jgi:PAS domain S-box-containing protein
MDIVENSEFGDSLIKNSNDSNPQQELLVLRQRVKELEEQCQHLQASLDLARQHHSYQPTDVHPAGAKSELNQAEDKLRPSERTYRALVENSPDTISLYDRQLRHVYISPEVERRSGIPAEFFLGKTAQQLGMPVEEKDRWERVAGLVFENGQPQSFEFRSWLGTQERYSQILLSPLFGEDGKTVEFVLGINRDITELKQVQRSLEERERQYRTLVENSPDIITRYDPALRVTFVNSRVEASTGRPASFYLGRNLIELGIPAEQIRVIKEVFQSGEAQQLEYSSGMSQKGHTRYFQARVVPEFDAEVRDDNNNIPGNNPNSSPATTLSVIDHQVKSIVTITTDITDLKASQVALAAEKERLAVTLRSIGEGVVATDTNGQITLFNARAEILTGWSAEEALGQPFEKVVRLFKQNDGTPLNQFLEEILEKGEMLRMGTNPSEQLILLRRSANEEISVSALNNNQRSNPSTQPIDHGLDVRSLVEGRASPIYQDGEEQAGKLLGMVFVFEDVTKRRRMEEELLKADKLQAVGVLAGGIAHDFNNFLTAILGNLAFIRRSISETDPLAKNLREAESACINARSLTQQLLTFARGGMPVKKDVAIKELLEETASFILRGSSSHYQVEVAPDLWRAELDRGQISQVIHNLVLNAQQAMPEGGVVRIRAKNVLVTAENQAELIPQTGGMLPVVPGPYLQIEVEDEGVGIPAKYLASIFDPYFTTKQKGNGLGLSVCYSIVKNHSGYITVSSNPGIGTTFYIYLPAILGLVDTPADQFVPSSSLMAENEAIPTTVQRTGPIRVLVMDDQEMILELVKDVLAESGFEVEVSRTGEEAVEHYRKALSLGRAYQVVIMDLTVPGGMGGKEALGQIKEIDPEVRAIVSSGYSNDPITSHYREYGFKAVLPKPFDIDELVRVVEQLALSKD